MAKKKTRVLLPGGIQGLVHDLQSGKDLSEAKVELKDDSSSDETVQEEPLTETPKAEDVKETEGVAEQSQPAPSAQSQPAPLAQPQPAVTAQSAQPKAVDAHPEAPAVGVAGLYTVPEPQEIVGRGRPQKVNTMKEYNIVRDDSADSWSLFLDLAQQYKKGGGKLATIYIDEELKAVLDRLKYAGRERLSTSAILSSIVARFIYDHADQIKQELYRPLN